MKLSINHRWVMITFDRHWINNTGWRRQGKLRRGFAIGPFIVLFNERAA